MGGGREFLSKSGVHGCTEDMKLLILMYLEDSTTQANWAAFMHTDKAKEKTLPEVAYKRTFSPCIIYSDVQ